MLISVFMIFTVDLLMPYLSLAVAALLKLSMAVLMRSLVFLIVLALNVFFLLKMEP
ncbi:unnamed protein product, partial [Prorocentrum cordatum]